MSRRISRPSSSSSRSSGSATSRGRLSYSSSTRSKAQRYVFTTQLPADDYTRANLEEFVHAIKREIDNGEISDKGVRMYDDYVKKLAAQEAGFKKSDLSTVQKAKANRELIYNFLKDWMEEFGSVPSLQAEEEGNKPSSKEMITKAQVEKVFNNGLGAVDLVRLIQGHSYRDFNIDALSKAASLLKVKGLTPLIKGTKGDEKREIIYDAIRNIPDIVRYAELLGDTSAIVENVMTKEELGTLETDQLRQILEDYRMDATGTRADLIERIFEHQERPTIKSDVTADVLKRLKVQQLQEILKSQGIPYSGMNKDKLVAKILATQGGGGNGGGEDVYTRVQRIIKDALYGNVINARGEVRKLGADKLDSLTVPDLRKLAHALGIKIPSNTKKEGIIMLLSGGEVTTKSSNEATRTRYKSSYKDCLSASIDEVRELAKSMGIRTAGVSHADLCKRIGEEFLHHAIDNFLLKTNTFVDDLNKAISYRTEKQRETAIKAIARKAGFDTTNVKTLASLLTQFFISHYRIRALNVNPDLMDAVSEYVADGVVPPPNDRHLLDFARIFSDLDPDLLSVEEHAIRDQLGILYGDIFGAIKTADDRAIDIIETYIAKLNYEIKDPTRRKIMVSETFREYGHPEKREEIVLPLPGEEEKENEYSRMDEVVPGVYVEEDREGGRGSGGTTVVVDPERVLDEEEKDDVDSIVDEEQL